MTLHTTERVGIALPLCLLFMGLAGPALSQDRISVDVNLVVLHATVTTSKGTGVSGLRVEDFQVYDNGKIRAVTSFNHEDIPVTVGLIVDHSGSMRPKIAGVTAAAETFARASNTEDEMFAVNFNDGVRYGLPSDDPFTSSPSILQKAISGTRTTGKTAFYDAVLAGLTQIQKGTRNKKVLIVISDGGDNASHASLAEVMKAAKESNAIIYTVELFNLDDPDRNPRVLENLARATGGEAFILKSTEKIEETCERIAKDIRSQYTLGFAAGEGNSWHTLRVVANAPHRGHLIVRTRAGYYPAITASTNQGHP